MGGPAGNRGFHRGVSGGGASPTVSQGRCLGWVGERGGFLREADSSQALERPVLFSASRPPPVLGSASDLKGTRDVRGKTWDGGAEWGSQSALCVAARRVLLSGKTGRRSSSRSSHPEHENAPAEPPLGLVKCSARLLPLPCAFGVGLGRGQQGPAGAPVAHWRRFCTYVLWRIQKMGHSSSRGRAGKYAERSPSPPVPAASCQSTVHSGSVAFVASMAPDLCVSGGKDKTVVVCNWSHGAVVRKFVGHQCEISKVTCLPNSPWVFSASRDKMVSMWDVQSSSRAVRSFLGHTLVVSGLAVSPVFWQLCTGSRDNAVCVWDIETGACLHRASVSRNLVTHLCWVPGERYIAQTSEDKTVRIWDSREMRVAIMTPAKQYPQISCDVSVDGHYCISSSSGGGGEATLWDLRQMRGLVHEFRGHLQSTPSCVFLPQGLTTFPAIGTSSHDGTVKVWSQISGACVATACLEGAGVLASLAVCGSSCLLCATSNVGISLLRLRSADSDSLELQEVTRF